MLGSAVPSSASAATSDRPVMLISWTLRTGEAARWVAASAAPLSTMTSVLASNNARISNLPDP
jgi:hypothetical protein